MSKWLTLAHQQISSAGRVPIVPIAPIAPIAREIGAFGTIGAIGTEPEAEIAERQAMAEIDGRVPPVFSLVFAAFQVTRPEGYRISDWRQAIDDAGRFLDSHGHVAATLGWRLSDLFAATGLAWALRGTTVSSLTATTAFLSDSRTFHRSGSSTQFDHG